MKDKNWKEDDAWTVEYYSNLLKEHSNSVKSLDWGTRASQELRFHILKQVGNLQGARLLDVGCGLGDFLAYLNHLGLDLQYTGCDIVPGMIELAQKRPFQHASFILCDFLDEQQNFSKYDYVVASGLFTFRRFQPIIYLDAVVRKMYQLCTRGIAFNVLSARAKNHIPGEFWADPGNVLETCFNVTDYVTIRHDYLPHDFTVYLYKDRISQ